MNACFGVGVEFTSDTVVDWISGSPKTGHLTRDRLSTRDGYGDPDGLVTRDRFPWKPGSVL
ncbi:MAG: hypothetical protein M0Q91_13450 [Methanoregula sp.]|nr:hypothetical protein [Methanoregula sp.]